MGSLKDVGCAVGEYVGDGKGEDGTDPLDDAAEADLPDSHDTDDRNEHGSTSLPLLVFYDCEATRLSTYSEHLTDIAAKVLRTPHKHCGQGSPNTSQTLRPRFLTPHSSSFSFISSLVRTSRNISAPGK